LAKLLNALPCFDDQIKPKIGLKCDAIIKTTTATIVKADGVNIAKHKLKVIQVANR